MHSTTGFLSRRSTLIFLYPWDSNLGDTEILKKWRLAGTTRVLQAACVDVGRTDKIIRQLRSLFSLNQKDSLHSFAHVVSATGVHYLGRLHKLPEYCIRLSMDLVSAFAITVEVKFWT